MSSNNTNAIDWFGKIDITKAAWGQYDPIFNYSEEFEKAKLENWVQDKHGDLSAARQKNILSSIHYFRDAADDFMVDVGNGNFYKTFDDEARNETIRTLRKYWKRTKEAYWGKDSIMNWNNNGTEYNRDISFGPWLFWSKSEWNSIDEIFDRWRSREIRNNIFNRNRNHNISDQNSQSVSRTQSTPSNQQQSQTLNPSTNNLNQHPSQSSLSNNNFNRSHPSFPQTNIIALPAISQSPKTQQMSAYQSFMSQQSSSSNPSNNALNAFPNPTSSISPNKPINAKSPSVQ